MIIQILTVIEALAKICVQILKHVRKGLNQRMKNHHMKNLEIDPQRGISKEDEEP